MSIIISLAAKENAHILKLEMVLAVFNSSDRYILIGGRAMSKRGLVLIVSLIYLIILGGCSSKPEIKVDIILSDITKEDYDKIGDNGKPKDIIMDDLKKLQVNVKITNSKKAVERNIEIPNLIDVINKFDNKTRGIYGGNGSQNNINVENTAEAFAYVIFDSRGVTVDDVVSMYSNSEIDISYKLKNDDKVEKKVSIGKSIN